jgi:hypothetical protein
MRIEPADRAAPAMRPDEGIEIELMHQGAGRTNFSPTLRRSHLTFNAPEQTENKPLLMVV